ncbi:MAG: hypothetical protein KIT72_12515 [Polyangiaceae bacterium]|nr:hypothetical protein [Polyangiaceae bacterium]
MKIRSLGLLGLVMALGACSSDDGGGGSGGSSTAGTAGTGGVAASGGTAGFGGSGGIPTGGTGGAPTGGTAGTGGAPTGGVGGDTTGGVGGDTTGGIGGAPTGGTGGTPGTGGTGGTPGTGGTGGTPGTGGTGGTPGTGGTGGTPGTGGTGGTPGTGGTGGTPGTGGTGGTAPTCTPVTLSNVQGYFTPNTLWAEVSPIGGGEPDFVLIEQWNARTGTFNLATPPNDNYLTSDEAVRGYEDVTTSGAARLYFQSAGNMTVSRVNTIAPQISAGSLSNVTLVEVTYDSSLNTTPVPGGRCLTVASASWDITNTCYDGGVEYSGANACVDCITDSWDNCCAAEVNACSPGCEDVYFCYLECVGSECDTCETGHSAADINAAYDILGCNFGYSSNEYGTCLAACQ